MSISHPSHSTTGFELSSDAIAAACLYIELCEKNGDCPNQKTPWMLGTNTAQKQALLFHPRCKLWSCPICAEINKYRLILRIKDGSAELIEAGQQPQFTTLTAHEKLTAAGTWAYFRPAWMKLSARIRYKFDNPAYVLLPELTKSNRWHWHGLIFADIEKRWLKDNARECGLGYMADAQPARTAAGCAWYGSKYITKGIESQAFKPGQHRYNFSRNFPALEQLERVENWSFEVLAKSTDVSYVFDQLRTQGYAIKIAGSKSAWEIIANERQPS